MLEYPQLNGRDRIPIQSVSVDLSEDSLDYIEYSLTRLENLMDEISPQAFYGNYEAKIIPAA